MKAEYKCDICSVNAGENHIFQKHVEYEEVLESQIKTALRGIENLGVYIDELFKYFNLEELGMEIEDRIESEDTETEIIR